MADKEFVDFMDPELPEHGGRSERRPFVPAVDHPDFAVIDQDRGVRVPDIGKPDFEQFCVIGKGKSIHLLRLDVDPVNHRIFLNDNLCADGSGAELILWDDINIGIYYSTPDKSVDPLTYIDTKTVK